MIVPNAPGGGTDTVARAVADRVGPALGQQILVDNRGGAGGAIAAEMVARSPKDGHTLLLGSGAALITGPALITNVMIANFLTALPQAREKRVRALGVTSLKRSTLAPDIASIDESGLRGFEIEQFYSIVAPAGTPAEIVSRLQREIAQRFAVAEVRQRLAHEGIELRTSTPAELGKLNAEQFEKWLKVIQQAGIAHAG